MKIVTDYEEISNEHFHYIYSWFLKEFEASEDGYFTVFGKSGIKKMTNESIEHFKSLGYVLSETVKNDIMKNCKQAVDDHEENILD